MAESEAAAASASSAPVLIVCAGRSGSTLLRAILSRHPDLHCSVESHFWLEAPPSRAFAAGPAEAVLEPYFASAPFRWLRLDKRAVLARLSGRATREQAFCALLQADAARHGKTRCGDKTPAHAFVLEQLLKALPDARVVHVVRDPRDVVASLSRMPWASASLLLNAVYTRLSCEAALGCDSERVLHLRHEELLAAPGTTLHSLLDHLQLHASDEIVRAMLHPDPATGAGASATVPWLAEGFGPIRAARGASGTASHALSPWAEALVERVCAHHMRIFGYAPRQPRRTLCRPAAAARCVLELGIAAAAALRTCAVVAMPSIDCLIGVSAERRAERQLGRWLNLNPAAWRHWPGWDSQRAAAIQLQAPLRGDYAGTASGYIHHG